VGEEHGYAGQICQFKSWFLESTVCFESQLYSIGTLRCVKEAGTSDTFPQFVGHWYTDLKIMTVTAAILFAKYMYLIGVLFLK